MRRSRVNSRNPLSQSSHRQLSKCEGLKTIFDCFWAAKVLLFGSFQGKRFLEHALICACLTRYGRSGMRFTLSQERTRLKGFGCSVRAHKKGV